MSESEPAVVHLPTVAPAVDSAALFRAHYGSLCHLAYLVLGDRDRSEEVVMEAFLRTLASWSRLRDPERAPAYLQRAVVNLARTAARRRMVERLANGRFSARPDAPPRPVDDTADADPVLRAVRALPPRQRSIVALRFYADLSESDVAAVLGCAVGTVKSQLAKAKATLARRLATEEQS